MVIDEIYKNILCLFNQYRYRDNNYIENLSYIYKRYYDLLKIEDKELADKVLSCSKNILAYINGEISGNELFIENVPFFNDVIKPRDFFFRSRTIAKTEKNYMAQNMFHIPLGYNKMQSGRYDGENKIRLYLSKSCFSCFSEVPETDDKDLMISLFKFDHTTLSQIVDLRLKSEIAFNQLNLVDKRKYMLCLPYILACMFIKKGALEYKFPQYVMSVLDYMDERLQKKHDGERNNVFTPYIGLSYISVYFDDEVIRRENNESLYDNYVFLAKCGRDNTGTSKLLSDMFVVTDPLRCQWDRKSNYREIEEKLQTEKLFKIQ